MHFIYTFTGCILTVLIHYLGFSAVFASSFIGVISSCLFLLLKENQFYSAAVFCGSFAGMTSLSFLFNQNGFLLNRDSILLVALMAFIVAGLYYTTAVLHINDKFNRSLFNGFGGRLGTIAFISVLIFIILKYLMGYESLIVMEANDYSVSICLLLIVITGISAFLTSWISNSSLQKINPNFKILVPSLLSFLACLFFSKTFNSFEAITQYFYAGTFVGMSSAALLSKRENLFAGMLASLFLIIGESSFYGVGGKLGFTAFIAVIFTLAIKKYIAKREVLSI